MNSEVVTDPWRLAAAQARSMSKNGGVAERHAQRVQRERAALVDAVVEHQVGPGVGEDEVLGQPRAAAASGPRRCACAGTPSACSAHSHSA